MINIIMNKNTPLVSVIVITYNSMPYVIETLDSIKAQTYQNIELIVTDDCSTKDNTIEAVSTWLSQNGDRFSRYKLITTRKNSGIAGNCNRGAKEANGEWIKNIAGDDILTPTYIDEMIVFCQQNNCDIACSDIQCFGDVKKKNLDYWQESVDKIKNLTTSEAQHTELMKMNFIPAASLIYKRDLFKEIGGFDEDCRFIEDYPFNLTVTANGHRVHLKEKKLVLYRISQRSVGYNPRFKMSHYIFDEKYRHKRRKWFYWLKIIELLTTPQSFFWTKGLNYYKIKTGIE